MNKSAPETNETVCLQLSSELMWNICPTDPESAEVIHDLKDIMHLSDGRVAGDTIYVSVSDAKRMPHPLPKTGNSLVCIIPRKINANFRHIQLFDLSRFIALLALPRGGILVHGALIAKDDLGVILAAPGGTGKTTASNRVGGSWRSLSDDATIIVKRDDGEYYAHPWPTWSRFLENGPEGNWEIEKGVRMCGIFFLNQGSENKASYLEKDQAISYLLESVHQVMQTTQNQRDESEVEELCRMEMDSIFSILDRIPAFILDISLIGPYWEVIEAALGEVIISSDHDKVFAQIPYNVEKEEPFFADGARHRVYSGSSMHPTLVEPGLKILELRRRKVTDR